MAEVKEVPTKFKATDGQSFDDRKDAEEYQLLLDAEGEFDRARTRFERVLAQSVKTADGKPFRIGVLSDYWEIRYPLRAPPFVFRVSFGYDTTFRVEDGQVTAFVLTQDDGRTFRRDTYRLENLYARESNAKKAARPKRIEWWAECLADMPVDERAAVLATARRAEATIADGAAPDGD